MRPRLAVIHWLDAAGNREDTLDAEGKERLRAVNCVSVGVLIERTRGRKGHVKVAGELMEGGEIQEVVVIPNGMVLSIRTFPLDLPRELGKWTLTRNT